MKKIFYLLSLFLFSVSIFSFSFINYVETRLTAPSSYKAEKLFYIKDLGKTIEDNQQLFNKFFDSMKILSRADVMENIKKFLLENLKILKGKKVVFEITDQPIPDILIGPFEKEEYEKLLKGFINATAKGLGIKLNRIVFKEAKQKNTFEIIAFDDKEDKVIHTFYFNYEGNFWFLPSKRVPGNVFFEKEKKDTGCYNNLRLFEENSPYKKDIEYIVKRAAANFNAVYVQNFYRDVLPIFVAGVDFRKNYVAVDGLFLGGKSFDDMSKKWTDYYSMDLLKKKNILVAKTPNNGNFVLLKTTAIKEFLSSNFTEIFSRPVKYITSFFDKQMFDILDKISKEIQQKTNKFLFLTQFISNDYGYSIAFKDKYWLISAIPHYRFPSIFENLNPKKHKSWLMLNVGDYKIGFKSKKNLLVITDKASSKKFKGFKKLDSKTVFFLKIKNLENVSCIKQALNDNEDLAKYVKVFKDTTFLSRIFVFESKKIKTAIFRELTMWAVNTPDNNKKQNTEKKEDK